MILWTVAHRTPLSREFSRQEYWSGLPFPSPGDLPELGIGPVSLVFPALAGGLFTTLPPWEAPSPTFKCLKCTLIIQLEKRLNTDGATVSVMNSFTGCNYWFTFWWWREDEGPGIPGREDREGIWKARIISKTWWFCTGWAKGDLGASTSQSGSGSTLLWLHLLCLTLQKGALFRGWANWGIKVYEVDLVIQECNVGFLTVSRTRLKHPNSAQKPPWLVSSF